MARFEHDPDELRDVYMKQVHARLTKSFLWAPAAIVAALLLFASIAYVPAGHVGVLTLFGRVTGEALPE
ncbi:MAG: hypothetical protein HYY26_04600, partial [Acidobacteria bacterium]|nr:hypothetical protein [Acidobacteriota bacterium]